MILKYNLYINFYINFYIYFSFLFSTIEKNYTIKKMEQVKEKENDNTKIPRSKTYSNSLSSTSSMI
jgi:large-conductance mechanosensitive channel